MEFSSSVRIPMPNNLYKVIPEKERFSDLHHRYNMIHLTLQLKNMLQGWIRREIIDFDPYEEANRQLQLASEPIQSSPAN
jgi:hypothetical protein